MEQLAMVLGIILLEAVSTRHPTPPGRIFFRHTALIFLEIHPVFLRQIALSGPAYSRRVCRAPFLWGAAGEKISAQAALSACEYSFLVGFFIAVAAYKPMRNRLILTKGYDADGGLGYILAGASIVLPIVLGINVVQSGLVLALCFIIPFVLNILLRIGKIGVGNAIMITALQTFGIIWVVIKFLGSFFSRGMGDMAMGSSSGGSVNRRNADAAKKAELYRQYQARVAEAETNRDEALTMMGGDSATDAKITAAEDDYHRGVSDIDHKWNG